MFVLFLALLQSDVAAVPNPVANATVPATEQPALVAKKVCQTVEIPTSRLPKRVCQTVMVWQKPPASTGVQAPSPR
jgi:hypothetical protein